MVMNNQPTSGREIHGFQPNKAITSSLHDFHKHSYEQAKLVFNTRMPNKILQLTALLKEKDEYRTFFEAEYPVNGKRARHDDRFDDLEISKAFSLAESEFEVLKMEVLELVDMVGIVKLWLQLNIPRIEDGNNFGVSIQTDTVGELSRVEDAALMTIENWSKFLMVRSKVVGKLHKHADGHASVRNMYRLTLDSMDEKQVRSVWIGWGDLRNNYAIIYDLLIKNIEKLLNPRPTNTSTMY